MTSGGSRNRSGPQRDPTSLRSSNVNFTALPSEGYAGEVPDFPLPDPSQREADLWSERWSTPQACAWALEPWRWHSVAMWVRTAVVCESREATAADKASLHRFADQVGLTPAGLKENGWTIAKDAIAAKREAAGAQSTSARDRMKVVQGGDG